MRINKSFILLFSIVIIIFFSSFTYSLSPSGGTVAAGTPQTSPTDGSGNNSAYAGNITYLGISGVSVTQTWQGYFGNVTGGITLADSSANAIYNWTLTEPSGEVYSSTNSSITWSSIQCFNFTANATGSVGSAGSTNLAGTNLTVLETRYNIISDDLDGVNETFSFTPAGEGHDAFVTASLSFSSAECLSTKLNNATGLLGANQFEEVLLYEPTTSSVVFASILEEGILNGFNQQDNDFQMIVLEDGHGADTTSTPYFFFVELQ